MLDILKNLEVFFENNYRRISIREYSRICKISPPTASKKLNSLNKEGLLIKEMERKYIFYFANRENRVFVNLSRVYWFEKFKQTGLLDELEKNFISPVIILFGSFSKAEITERSDIDIAVFSPSEKNIELSAFEKRLKRKIQIFIFKDFLEIKNREFLNNLLNGFKLTGNW